MYEQGSAGLHLDGTPFCLISDKMISHSNVFALSMKFRVLRHADSQLMVLEYHNWFKWLLLKLQSASSLFSQIRSLAATVSDIYRASAVDMATQDCFLLPQLTVAFPILNKYPDVDFLSSISPAQSKSENPVQSDDSVLTTAMQTKEYQ